VRIFKFCCILRIIGTEHNSISRDILLCSVPIHKEFLPRGTSTGKSLSEALLFEEHGENMLCTKIVSVHYKFPPGLSLEFSFIELVILTSDKDLPVTVYNSVRKKRVEYCWLHRGRYTRGEN
jgi:hypothetical protein